MLIVVLADATVTMYPVENVVKGKGKGKKQVAVIVSGNSEKTKKGKAKAVTFADPPRQMRTLRSTSVSGSSTKTF
jgi:hypothetical protein